MNIEILIILFLVFSVGSSLINKIRDYQKRQEMDRPIRPVVGPRAVGEPDEEEIDLSEWEIFRDDPPEVEQSEFQPIQGRRSVSEESTGDEFQEVHGKREVEEGPPEEEFRKPVVDEPSELPEPERKMVRRKRKAVKLALGRNTLRQAIIYNEVIGPPRAENMPW